jgi:hypothetical protein
MSRSSSERNIHLLPVLTATRQTQGNRASDFCYATVGELVRFGSECDGEPIDGSCGCRRSLAGLDSGKSTTTFCVTRLPLTRQEVVAQFTESLRRTGWLKLLEPGAVDEMVNEHLDIARAFPEGAILERRGDEICRRDVLHPAVGAEKDQS